MTLTALVTADGLPKLRLPPKVVPAGEPGRSRPDSFIGRPQLALNVTSMEYLQYRRSHV